MCMHTNILLKHILKYNYSKTAMKCEKLPINKILNAYFKGKYNNSKNDHSNVLFFRSTIKHNKI